MFRIRVTTNILLITAVAFSFFAASRSFAGDWPQWRGPNGNGTSTETGWKAEFPKEGPKKLWESKIGGGHSSLVVANKHVYTCATEGPKKEGQLVCLDALSGAQVWKHPFAAGAAGCTTPVVDGSTVIAISDSGYLMAVEAGSGKELWGKDIMKELGVSGSKGKDPAKPPAEPRFGSPLIVGDTIVIGPGFGFEKSTGKLLWKSSQTECRSYVTSVPATFGGTPEAVVYTSQDLIGFNPKDGNELWSLKLPKNVNVDPTILAESIFYDGTLIKMEAGKPVVQKAATPPPFRTGAGLANPALWQGNLYASTGGWGKVTPGSYNLKCIDTQTFAEKWTQAGTWGPLIVVDGKILVSTHLGELVIAKASPESYQEISRAMIYPDAVKSCCWGTPAFAEGKFYMRCNGLVACLDLSGN